MAKIFTITEGLENLGAMKTGGQGSVYKGRRTAKIITAIKLLPTPVYSESAEDKNYTDFINEVEKLKKVNEVPNPHVVTILSSGITDTGNFPFIEMEFIEGPDLEDLLKPPHDPVFTISETIKVAQQLSDALAHCHKLNVKHGDIKSNNVKFNSHTGNYILLDFGLSAMSDEQRRTSLRHAGAIEFMAPEQNEGEMLLQTDVYSFGIILYELLAGTVPFPLHDKGETSRNQVRLAHMEAAPPDMLELRRQHLPEVWRTEKKDRELQVPDWLVSLVRKCMEKNPAQRFANGVELHDFIVVNATLPAFSTLHLSGIGNNSQSALPLAFPGKSETFEPELIALRQKNETREKEINELKALVLHKDDEIQRLRSGEAGFGNVSTGKNNRVIIILLLICIFGAGSYAAYKLYYKFIKPPRRSARVKSSIETDRQANTTVPFTQPEEPVKKEPKGIDTPEADPPKAIMQPAETFTDTAARIIENGVEKPEPVTPDENNELPITGRYKVVSKAYFYDRPEEDSRRNAYIVHWNNVVLNGLEEQNGFVYVVFTNNLGQTSKGWLRVKDLNKVEE